MEDKTFARKCDKLFKKGSKWTDKNLFNGEYYIHKLASSYNQRGHCQRFGGKTSIRRA